MTTPQQQLTREGILAIPDIQTETVDVPEWGGAVLVQGLTAAERDDFEASCVQGRGRKATVNIQNIRAKAVVLAVRDATGARIFSLDDAPALGRKNAAAVNRIFEVFMRMNGLSEEDVEELAGNSERGQPGATLSGLPARSE